MTTDANPSSAIAALENQLGAQEVVPADTPLTEDVPRTWMLSIPRSEGIGDQVMRALDQASILADLPETEALRDYVGKPITIHSAVLDNGEIDGRQTWYIRMQVTDDSTGTEHVVTTGAEYVMHQIARCYLIPKGLPLACKPYEVKMERKGMNDPLHLGPVDRF